MLFKWQVYDVQVFKCKYIVVVGVVVVVNDDVDDENRDENSAKRTNEYGTAQPSSAQCYATQAKQACMNKYNFCYNTAISLSKPI